MNTLPYAAAFRPRSFAVRPAWRRAAAALLLAVGGVAAQAQILIGQTTAVTGPVAASVGETLVGVRLYLDHVNARGGVHGEQIRLITLDDKFEPKLAGENARQLIEEHKVAALFMSRATPHTQAILPHLAKHQIALIAPSTGAMVLHQPVNPLVFNVRAMGYGINREADALVKAKGDVALSPQMMEGFAGAKVLVEALRRAGPKPTRERIVAALGNMSHYDLGGLELGFGPGDRTGLNFVELSIIGSDGRFRR